MHKPTEREYERLGLVMVNYENRLLKMAPSDPERRRRDKSLRTIFKNPQLFWAFYHELIDIRREGYKSFTTLRVFMRLREKKSADGRPLEKYKWSNDLSVPLRDLVEKYDPSFEGFLTRRKPKTTKPPTQGGLF